MAENRYDPITQTLHWLTLGAVTAAYVTSMIMDEMAKGVAKTQMQGTHMSFGLIVGGLLLLRLVWRMVATRPTPLASSRTMAMAASAVHIALYVTLLAVPLLGIVMVWAKGRPVDFFGLFSLAPMIDANRGLAHSLEDLHEAAANLMVTLAGLHAAAALLHQYVLKDGALSRMTPRFLMK